MSEQEPIKNESAERRSNIEVLILTHNEEINLTTALRSVVEWADTVYVIDSESTDRTREIAEEMGAEVIVQPWLGYAKQKNWALRTLPWKSDWIFILDADESITPELRDELLTIAQTPTDLVHEAGFYVNRLTYFMGKAIKHSGFFPSYNLRFFKNGRAWYEDREVHEHMVVDGTTKRLKQIMLHNDRRGLEHFIAKHNRYSTLEARELIAGKRKKRGVLATQLETGIALRRWLKYNVQPVIPFAGLWRFLYMYVLRFGFLDGVTGFRFCLFLSMYDYFITLKCAELRRLGHDREFAAPAESPVRKGLAIEEGVISEGESMEEGPRMLRERERMLSSVVSQMRPESSPWSTRDKIKRTVWMLIGRPMFRFSFHNWYGFRVRILRLFGARVGQGVRIRPSVHIEIPWHLTFADGVTVGDGAILYSLGHITIGAHTIVSQYAHLCAGTHDYTDHRFLLLRPPITIAEDVWIGADAFVGPNVHVGRQAVLGARSSTYKSLDAGMVYIGNPAKSIKSRVLK